jgi:hypothetical protein
MSSSGPTSNETGDEKDVVQRRRGPLTRGVPLDRSSLDEEPGVLPASNKSTSHASERITTPPASLRESLRMEDAETAVLSKVEQDRARSVPMEDGFQAAVQGESAPLGAAALNKSFVQDTSQLGNALGGQQKFADLVMRVRDLQRASKSKRESLERLGGEMMSKSHRRVATLLSSIDEKKNEGSFSDARNGTESQSFRVGDLGSLFDEVHHVDRLPEITHDFSQDDAQTGTAPDERLPLLNSETRYDGSSPNGSTADPSMERRRQAQINYWEKVSNCLNPLTIIRKACLLVFHSFFMIAIPLFAAAWILFYFLGNPEFDFLPGDARLSWWLNFFGTLISRFDRLSIHILGSYLCPGLILMYVSLFFCASLI